MLDLIMDHRERLARILFVMAGLEPELNVITPRSILKRNRDAFEAILWKSYSRRRSVSSIGANASTSASQRCWPTIHT